MEKIERKLFEIYDIIKQSSNVRDNFGFLTGLSGELFFLHHFSRFYPVDKDILLDKLNGLIQSVEAYPGDASFCEGISGVCYLLSKISAREDFGVELGKEANEFVCLSLNSYMKRNKYEFLYGFIGLGQYLLVDIKNHIKELNMILDYLETNKMEMREGYAWSSINSYNEKEINLGMSHGMASILVFLSKIYSSKMFEMHSSRILELIDGGVEYLLSQQQDINIYHSFFPYCSSLEMPKKMTSRLGWCYGDLSAGIALSIVGNLTGNKRALNCADKVFTYAALNRRDPHSNLVDDPGLCHGASGIAALFNRMWWNTGNYVYKEAYDYWINMTLCMANKEDGLAGYNYHSRGIRPTKGTHFLEGISGIGMVLLYYLHNFDPEWDECLFIS